MTVLVLLQLAFAISVGCCLLRGTYAIAGAVAAVCTTRVDWHLHKQREASYVVFSPSAILRARFVAHSDVRFLCFPIIVWVIGNSEIPGMAPKGEGGGRFLNYRDWAT